jgi:hypothetical protein
MLSLAGAALLATSPARAADTYSGTITAGAQKVVFTHGFAWIDAKGRVSVGFYKSDPTPEEQARAMKDGGSIFGVFDATNVTVDLNFKEGSAQADLASFESCHINFWKFDVGVGTFDWNTSGKGCGPIEFSGPLKAGSVIHGKLKGTAEGFPGKDGKAPVYTWDVAFTATVRAKK